MQLVNGLCGDGGGQRCGQRWSAVVSGVGGVVIALSITANDSDVVAHYRRLCAEPVSGHSSRVYSKRHTHTHTTH